jgi:carbonic anhydrase
MAPSPRMGYPLPPMEQMERLLENNRRWASKMTASDPQFFTSRAAEQAPQFLFVGCSDSRVPAEVLTGSLPGEMFVHRNVANQVLPADLNVPSILQFAVEILGRVIVCGHYGWGGVRAAMGSEPLGLLAREPPQHHATSQSSMPSTIRRHAAGDSSTST